MAKFSATIEGRPGIRVGVEPDGRICLRQLWFDGAGEQCLGQTIYLDPRDVEQLASILRITQLELQSRANASIRSELEAAMGKMNRRMRDHGDRPWGFREQDQPQTTNQGERTDAETTHE